MTSRVLTLKLQQQEELDHKEEEVLQREEEEELEEGLPDFDSRGGGGEGKSSSRTVSTGVCVLEPENRVSEQTGRRQSVVKPASYSPTH